MSRYSDWGIPAGLIALSVIPIAAGAVRLTQLAGGVVTAENARFFNSPISGNFAYRGHHAVQPLGRAAVCPPHPRQISGLAPLVRPLGCAERARRRAVRPLVGALLSAAADRRDRTLCHAACRRRLDDICPLPGVFRHQGARHRQSPELDAARLCHRDGRGHAGADQSARHPDSRPARHSCARCADGRGLGDQRNIIAEAVIHRRGRAAVLARA